MGWTALSASLQTHQIAGGAVDRPDGRATIQEDSSWLAETSPSSGNPSLDILLSVMKYQQRRPQGNSLGSSKEDQ